MEILINLGIVVLIAGITYALSSEGLWGAALMFFNVIFAGLITFNFYEPLAGLMAGVGFLSGMADVLALLGIFTVALLLLRLTTESLAPAMVRFPTALYQGGRFAFALGAACTMMAIVILAFEVAPVHKKVLGVVDYKFQPPFKMGFDRYWLGFFQYSTGYIFPRYINDGDDREFGNALAFDPEGRWLLDHQDARPHGVERVLEEAPAAADPAAEGGQPPAPGGGLAPS